MVLPNINATGAVSGLPNGARVILAPLCGITTSVFRKICLDQGAEMAVTEMISSDAMTRGNERHCRAILGLDVAEGPLSIQMFGSDPERMGKTAARLSELRPVYIDMNFGCPVKKIVTRNGGSAVLRDLDLLSRICKRVVERSGVPVSAKIRAGWDKPSGEQVREICQTIEDAGVSMIAMHARTRKQGFSGEANWELISHAKEAVDIPVIGNGDIRTADDVVNMVNLTGCDAVMIGRGAIGNPWIFDEVKSKLDEKPFQEPTVHERVEVLLEHCRRQVAVDGEPLGLVVTRKVMAAYVKHLPNARDLRGKLMQITTISELEDTLANYLEVSAV